MEMVEAIQKPGDSRPGTSPNTGGLPMQFAYWTIDEVNRDLAERLAARAQVGLELCDFRDQRPEALAQLYDLDSFPPDRRAALLADLKAARRSEPVAIHTYRLPARDARRLRPTGVCVVPRPGRGGLLLWPLEGNAGGAVRRPLSTARRKASS